MDLRRLLLGRRLLNREGERRRIGWFEAVPAMGLDGLGSASYGPEAALAMMAPLGAASLNWIGVVMAPIILLLVVLYLSYRQMVVAYQTNGGAYTVAKSNLGRYPSLLAAAALMIDYVLNVAVGISAGVGALTSTLPSLGPYTLALCLVILAVVTVANLRGTGEAGWLWALPTYLFLVSFIGLEAVGIWRTLASGGHPRPIVRPPAIAPETAAVSLWLLMRAFAAGCTAMTGVEAVSNAVGAFKSPVTRRAHQTLTVICASLGLLLAGVAALAHSYGLAAMDQTRPGYQSVLAQLAGAVAGRGVIYYTAMASVLAVLCLSANTSFVDFPRLARLVAKDGFLPRPLAAAGRRLVFSLGILLLAACAAALLIAFGGITDRLIPLFAIGAFLTFTLSQVGMVAHWSRERGPGAGRRLAINALGAAITLVALVIIVLAKFAGGAWIVVIAIAAILATLVAIRRYYDRLDASLHSAGAFRRAETEPPSVLVVTESRNRMTDQALSLAMTLSPDVIAVHLQRLEGPDAEEDAVDMRRQWQSGVEAPLIAVGQTPPRLVLLPAPTRQMWAPLLEFVERLDLATPGRSVAVLIPEMVMTRWWERLLHARRAQRLRAALLAHGGPRLNVIITPWRREVSGAEAASARAKAQALRPASGVRRA